MLAALDRTARSVFIVLAVSGLVLTVSPFNVLDVPIMQPLTLDNSGSNFKKRSLERS